MQPPNVVLIMTDQQRWDTLSCSGGPAETPNLDWLASRGTRFTSAYSATPSCTPARASLMTGLDPWHTGILGMGKGQPPCANLGDTLPARLGAAGYHTIGIGKMHFSPQRSLQGFDYTVIDESRREEDPRFASDYTRWFNTVAPTGADRYEHGIDFNSWLARPSTLPEYLHATNWTASQAILALQRRDPSRPTFLKLSFARPHSPYDPPEYYFGMYEGRTPPPAVGDWAAVNDVPRDAADPNAWRGRMTPRQIARARAGYLGSVSHIDAQIGRFLIELRRSGLDRNTMIIFCSDHGDMLGDHHLWRKTYAYEGSAHIPLIVKLPGAMADDQVSVSDAPVVLQDIMPTILDVCGVESPKVDGRSLRDECLGDSSDRRDYIHGEHSTCYDESQEMQYLTDGRWKYVWLPRGGGEQLFDLGEDPYECEELSQSPDHVDTLALWRGRLIDILRQRGAGLTDESGLVDQTDRPYLVAPAARDRVVVFS